MLVGFALHARPKIPGTSWLWVQGTGLLLQGPKDWWGICMLLPGYHVFILRMMSLEYYCISHCSEPYIQIVSTLEPNPPIVAERKVEV